MVTVIGVLGALLIMAITVIVSIIISYLGEERLWIFNKEYWLKKEIKKEK